MMAITQKNLTCRIVKLSKVVGNTSFMCRFIENFISLIEDLTNHFQANADCSFSINKKKWSSIVNYVDICSTLFPNVKLAKAVEESKKIEKHFRFTEKLKKLTTDNHPFKRALRNLSNGSSKKEICSAHNCTFSNYNALYYHLKAYHPEVRYYEMEPTTNPSTSKDKNEEIKTIEIIDDDEDDYLTLRDQEPSTSEEDIDHLTSFEMVLVEAQTQDVIIAEDNVDDGFKEKESERFIKSAKKLLNQEDYNYLVNFTKNLVIKRNGMNPIIEFNKYTHQEFENICLTKFNGDGVRFYHSQLVCFMKNIMFSDYLQDKFVKCSNGFVKKKT